MDEGLTDIIDYLVGDFSYGWLPCVSDPGSLKLLVHRPGLTRVCNPRDRRKGGEA